jgi:D-alanyl-D-alanine dipeptidase
MWDTVDIPINERGKFVSNPKNGSLHNYGAAVDLTIAKLSGEELDMGTPYDDASKLSYPEMEAAYLQKGELTNEQIANRILLRAVLSKGGFWNIQTEWWHFNSCNREQAKEKYKIVE